MSYFTLKSGEKLYYEDMGQGPDTLIMMHGWTNSHEVFLKPAELLQQ
jgi:pimeloyl-ACP methyl ester carboxylesterase